MTRRRRGGEKFFALGLKALMGQVVGRGKTDERRAKKRTRKMLRGFLLSTTLGRIEKAQQGVIKDAPIRAHGKYPVPLFFFLPNIASKRT